MRFVELGGDVLVLDVGVGWSTVVVELYGDGGKCIDEVVLFDGKRYDSMLLICNLFSFGGGKYNDVVGC